MSKHAAMALVSLSLDQYLAEAKSVVDVASFGQEDVEGVSRAQFDAQIALLTGLFVKEEARVTLEPAAQSTFMLGAEWFIEGSMRAQRVLFDRFIAARTTPELHIADDGRADVPRRALSETH